MDFTPGQRVRVAPGLYRIGRSPNAHIRLDDGATGTVHVVHEHGLRPSGNYQADPTMVLVYLDLMALPNPHAPTTAMVPPANLSAA